MYTKLLTKGKESRKQLKKHDAEPIEDRFPELTAASERVLGEAWGNEDDELWESYLRD